MKEFDRVRLIKERDKYAKEGVHKGAVGTIMMDDVRNGYVLVFFDGEEYINKYGERGLEEIDVGVLVEDLEVLDEKDPDYIPRVR